MMVVLQISGSSQREELQKHETAASQPIARTTAGDLKLMTLISKKNDVLR